MSRSQSQPKSRQIPVGAKKRGGNILALGEHTGHFHEATGPGVATYEHGDSVYIDTPQGSVVTHQEHGPVPLPCVPYDSYERRIVREYDHLAEEIRNVVD